VTIVMMAEMFAKIVVKGEGRPSVRRSSAQLSDTFTPDLSPSRTKTSGYPEFSHKCSTFSNGPANAYRRWW
jgi:hypothetical protein